MSKIFVCSDCGCVYEDYGDDHWLECPFCRSQKFRKAVLGKDYYISESEVKE